MHTILLAFFGRATPDAVKLALELMEIASYMHVLGISCRRTHKGRHQADPLIFWV